MSSLYGEGWRQGSIVSFRLPLDTYDLNPDGGPHRRSLTGHGLWVVASQDCDLSQTDCGSEAASIELRPVFGEDPPSDMGVRSRRFLLMRELYVKADSPRPMVSPRLLHAYARGRRDVSGSRRLAFKIWLGLRYDRPAVPEEFLGLAKRIAEAVSTRSLRPVGRRVRDVLMQFGPATDNPLRFSLWAIVQRTEDREVIRDWLAEIALKVPSSLGVADELEAGTSSEIAFSVIENSYAADVRQLTWRPNEPEPEGAI